MEKEYLDEPPIVINIKKVGNLLERYNSKVQKDVPTTKKRGGLNEITELRYKTATLIKKPIGQVNRLTGGWTKAELRDTLKLCQSFINPPALWWTLYKKNNYGRNRKKGSNTETLLRDGKKGRNKKFDERQGILF